MPVSSLRFSQTIVGSQDYAAGIRYSSSTPDILTTAATTASTTGTLYFQPFVCTFTHTFTGISFYNSASVNTQKFRMGVYNSSGRLPTSLVTDGGELTVADTNTNTLREIASLTIALTASKMYWLAWYADTNSSSVIAPATFTKGDQCAEFGNGAFTSGGPGVPVWLKMTQAYGALPANASSLSISVIATGGMPLLYLKG